ncbi:MAG TPA: ABC transporter permease [Vicinamibacterales bacterium]|nr:ABC transporter permease [Vicinamibacterales bacterium]
MTAWRVLAARLRGMCQRRRRDAAIDDEIQAHLDLLAADYERRGLSPAEARLAARRDFGGVEQVKEHYRDERGARWPEAAARELRIAVRSLRRSPVFTATAVATLGVAIGAATTIFAVVDVTLLRPLPYPNPDRLVVVTEVVPALARIGARLPVNAVHAESWRSGSRSFDGLALIGPVNMNLVGDGDPERVPAARVSPGLFRLLGVRPGLGRLLRPDDDRPGHDHVVVLDDGLWRRRFGGDPGVVGRRITLDDESYEVVGVLPPSFAFPPLRDLLPLATSAGRPEVWKPFALTDRERAVFGDFNYVCIGRLRDGVSVDAAMTDLNGVQAGFASRVLGGAVQLKADVTPMGDQVVAGARSALVLMTAAVALVLLVACGNIASLLFARSVTRRRELAIRSAIGAGRGWLLWHVLAESLVLSTAGAVVGIGIASVATGVFVSRAPIDLPRAGEIHVDVRVLLFAALVSVAAGILTGLMPAWRSAASTTSHASAIRDAGRATPPATRFRAVLVGGQVALTAVALVLTGLLVHSLVAVLNVNKGFDAGRLISVDLHLPPGRYADRAAATRFIDALRGELSSVTAVSSVATSNLLPLGGEGANNAIFIDGAAPTRTPPVADVRTVSPGFFGALGIPVLEGSGFVDTDRARRIAVVSASAAARLWPGGSAVGRRFAIGEASSRPIEVVGVVGDVHSASLEKRPSITVYVPYWSTIPGNHSAVAIAARAGADARTVESTLSAAIHRVDPQLAVPPFRWMDDVVGASVALRRFETMLIALFGVAALLLSAIGLYGVVAQTVAQRAPEIGIRVALGAARASVVRLVAGTALRPLTVGLLIGAPVAAGVAGALRSMLYGVQPFDLATFAAMCTALALTAAAAIAIPLRRAMRIEPATVLRSE